MKKLIILTMLLCMSLTATSQKADFGITGGYLNVRGNVKSEDISASGSESGFYMGILADLKLSNKFHVQPQLLYAVVRESDAIFLPVIGKWYLNDKLNLQLGPQLVFTLEEVPDDITGTVIHLAGGIGVDITSVVFTEILYTSQINNTYTGVEAITIRSNYLSLGLGFRFRT